MSKIILFMFAGREENMRVQMPYLHRILDDNQDAELHLWDLTRRASDATYLRWVSAGCPESLARRIKIMDNLHPGHPIRCAYPGRVTRPRGHRPCRCLIHKPPYEKPYEWYAANGQPDTIYVKVDDDVLFLETERFNHLIDPLRLHPNRIISASVVNNAVCAKYLPEMVTARIANYFSVGDPRKPTNDKRWWELHTMPEFARYMHEWFLDECLLEVDALPTYVRTRPGEAVSINCIAFTQATMKRLAPMMNDRLGDEGAVDRLLPWICTSFRAAHLTFGPQDAGMSQSDLDKIRLRYEDLGKAYLS